MTYTVTYADANFNTSTLAAANITLNKTGHRQRQRSARHRLGPDPDGHDQRHHGRWYAGDFHRRRHRLGPGRQPGPGRRAQRTFTVDNTAPTISIGAPSASYVAGGPVTYTVTYADANFNSSTLAAANITLNKTGTANGTLAVSGTGTDPHGHHQQHYGRRLAGDFDRRRHGLGPGREPGPGRRPSAHVHVDNTAPTIAIARLGVLCRQRAGDLHGDLCRRRTSTRVRWPQRTSP